MNLNVFTTIGGDYQAFACFIIKCFDNTCHFWNNEIPFKYENRHDYTVSAREVYSNQNKTRAGGLFSPKEIGAG